jgi:S-(hydroxymethyl)glutathione dehydrogenase / alcohol dehydrogenase
VSEPQRIRAAVYRKPGERGSVEDVLLDPPAAGEVLVRVAAAGVCHSDLHIVDGDLGDRRFPTVLGHEGAGVVEAVGKGVERVAPGDRVAFCFVASCGSCAACRSGRAVLCETGTTAAFRDRMLDGTTRLCLPDGQSLRQFLSVGCFAERCVVSEAAAVRLPDALPLWQAAVVGCAAVTGFGAVRNAANVGEGESVCVVGCGGVGLQVIAAARLAGADPIVAVDRVPAKLDLALAAGATHGVAASGDTTAAEIRELSGGGVRHAFEVIGTAGTIRLAFDVLRPGGTAVVVGLAPLGVEAAVPAAEFLSEKSLRGSFYGSGNPAREIGEIAELLTSGRLDLTGSISHLTDLDGIEEALARMRRGEGARTVAIVDPELAGSPEAL